MVKIMKTKDDRIVCGAVKCLWWDHIKNASVRKDSKMPCCPICGALLLEFQNEAEWWQLIDEHDLKVAEDYRGFILWLRGKCYPDAKSAKKDWERSVQSGNN